MSNYARSPISRVTSEPLNGLYSRSSKQLFVVWPDPHVGPLGNACKARRYGGVFISPDDAASAAAALDHQLLFVYTDASNCD